MLRLGTITFLDTAEPLLAFTRDLGEQRMLICFNISPIDIEVPAPLPEPLEPLVAGHLNQGRMVGDRLQLPGHGALFARVVG